jgi:hypothetical protein
LLICKISDIRTIRGYFVNFQVIISSIHEDYITCELGNDVFTCFLHQKNHNHQLESVLEG